MSEVFNPQNRVQSKAKAEARTTAPLKPKAGLNGPPSTALQLGAPGVPSKVSRCGTLFHSVAATLTAALRRRGARQNSRPRPGGAARPRRWRRPHICRQKANVGHPPLSHFYQKKAEVGHPRIFGLG